MVTLGTGLGLILGGAIVQSRDPVVESKDLPSEERVRLVPHRASCGASESLTEVVVAAALSSGGTWTGVVNASGAVPIDLSGASTAPGTMATFRLESVPPGASPFLSPGMPLGQLKLASVHRDPLASAPRRAVVLRK